MKRFAVPVLYLFLLSAFAVAADQPAAGAAKDKKFLENYLKQTKKDFLKSIDGLSEEQWKYKPAADKWSVAEVAEHIALSEDFISGNVKNKVMKTPAATDAAKAEVKGKEDFILKAIPDRSSKFQAPEQLRPASKFANRKELEKAFRQSRDGNIDFAEDMPESELRAHIDPSPVGNFDAYQWLLFMAAHTKRHTDQIAEVKADPNFPKK